MKCPICGKELKELGFRQYECDKCKKRFGIYDTTPEEDNK